MSQGSLSIPTTGTLSGLALVQAINEALANLSSEASGSTDPSTLPGGVLPFSLWADTSAVPSKLRQRNAANTGWITVGDLTQENWGLSQGAYRVAGLSGANNAVAPNTKFDMSADLVTLRNPSSGACVTLTNTGAIICDTGVAGPTANGRDQAGAFSASSWIHFYFIWNGSTLATLASTVAPPTGPTLPTGYTHWAYCCAVYFNVSAQLMSVSCRGNRVTYAGGVSVLSGGSATNATSVGLSTAIPPNAVTSTLMANLIYSDTGTTTLNFNVYWRTPTIFLQIGITEPVAGINIKAGTTFELPNSGQAVSYAWDTVSGTRNGNLAVLGYTVPNGG